MGEGRAVGGMDPRIKAEDDSVSRIGAVQPTHHLSLPDLFRQSMCEARAVAGMDPRIKSEDDSGGTRGGEQRITLVAFADSIRQAREEIAPIAVHESDVVAHA